ncbi:hypothetical protein EC973_001783 [Apophysomyces ossiformis]|uniref:High-temperature-induced dauer-formation protein n=1 Tax=Apophysomyces ossiformis TaxID=679940 RepID=A0A8H7BNS7_9FUNG|nr:hypothetical protein EC973_001783 [Apophysomyces ossiformis]
MRLRLVNHTLKGAPEEDQKSHPQYDTLPPRGEILLTLTLRCLFLAGFTLPSTMGTAESRVNYVIWETGVGSSTPIGSSRDNDMNRTEVLRLLIVLLSKSMYITPSQVLSKEDPWLNFIITRIERKVVLALLCSLLNTACRYNPLGWGVPYNHVVFADTREQLVAVCLRVLLVILDYHSPQTTQLARQNGQTSDTSATEIATGFDVRDPEKRALAENGAGSTMEDITLANQEDTHEPVENAFRHYMSKLHRAQDFQFLIDGIYRILSNPMQANSTYLPGSTKRVRCHVEMMMLCWKILEINSRFRNYLMDTERALDLMVVLIYHAVENKLNPAQVGLVRMCTFILQTLSSDRTFGVKLNRTFDGHSSLPASVRIAAFHGTYADFLIISIFSLIATSRGTLSTLYPAMILTIANVSPYLKNLSVSSASKLLALFGSISAPGFLLADEANHRLVGYLLEAFNNIIQYQFSDNPNLVYSIVRNHAKFEKLRDFTLEGAVTEIEHLRQLKEEKLGRSAANPIPATTATTTTATISSSSSPLQEASKSQGRDDIGSAAERLIEEAQTEELSEKAKGKLPENSKLSRHSSQASLPSMPERQASVSSMVSAGSLLPGAKNGFIPTADWVSKWHSELPLLPILTLLDNLIPQVEEMCTTQSLTTDQQVLDFLRGVTLVGILPPPQPIFIRKFQWGEALVIWFRSMLWGQAYVSSISVYGPWNGTQVKLFQIKQQIANQSTEPSSSSSPRNSVTQTR